MRKPKRAGKPRVRALAPLLAFLVTAALVSTRADAQEKKEAKKEAAASCGDCHEQAAAFAANPHARGQRKAGDKTPLASAVCESCHGDGTKHMEAGGDKSLIQVLKGRAGAETCLSCHKKSTEHASFKNGVHASTEQVNCLTCHSIHKAERKEAHLLVSESVALCQTCHESVVESFKSYPYTHRLKPGALSCVSCHVMHSQSGSHALKQTKGGEPGCVTCHSETRGPFAFPHVTGVAGDCATCHKPHGSSYQHMLKRATVAQQCLECHSTLSGGTLGSQPPSVHNLSLPRWQNCTVCHTAVHGSNRSPQLLK
jgi:DmsE family decaheme c-type cytochrome